MQLDIFQPAANPAQPPHTLARRSDPFTSHAAASPSERRASHYGRILGALRAMKALGAEQIGAIAQLPAHEVRRRLPELEKAGEVEVAPGERKTVYGRAERLWRIPQPKTEAPAT